ncbi:MAG: DUF1971 domain-containing protein [Gammaproteobacteria bacterium]
MSATLPEGLTHYKSTPTFTHESVPSALLADHSTKAGVWGVLNVESGSLKYVITEIGHEAEQRLKAGESAVIVSEQTHYVKPLGNVAFHVAFYK